MSQEVADTLRKALDVLRERGLAKGTLEDRRLRVCSRGAINVALHGFPLGWLFASNPRGQAADGVLCDVVREHWPERCSRPVEHIVDFNNHPDTTQDDVERAFEKAIARAEEMV